MAIIQQEATATRLVSIATNKNAGEPLKDAATGRQDAIVIR